MAEKGKSSLTHEELDDIEKEIIRAAFKSLRDEFAMAALNYVGNLHLAELKRDAPLIGEDAAWTTDEIANMAYELADAMLKRRSKKDSPQ